MAAAEPLPSEDDDPSSLTKCHEALAGGSNGQEPSESWGEGDPELSAREQSCLRRLHAWGEQNSGSRLREPRGEESNSIPWSAFRPGTAPARVGRFEVVRELGRGGFGIVFLAFDPLLCREVALKLPAPQVVVTPGLCDRFLREARAAAGLSHPNLVNVYETGAWGVAAYIAIEYCPGETLAAWLQNRAEPVPVTSAATLVATLARALDYAHNQGVIHRDLKPSNIVLVANPGSSSAPSGAVDLGALVPKITDFGLAKLIESDPAETRSTAILGTPIYMAPEQAESRLGDIGPHTDVYALGVTLYEMLTGRVPFSGATEMETLKRLTQDEPQPPRRLRPEVPRDLEAVCLKCLEKQPSARYQTGAALGEDLGRFLAFLPTQARPLGPFRRSLRWGRRRPAVTALLAIAVLIGLAATVTQRWHAADLQNALALNARIRRQAEEQRRDALDHARRTRQYRYARDTASAFDAWRMGRVEQALELLANNRPKMREDDPRGFAWHYVWRLCHAERLTIHGHGGSVYSVSYSLDGKKLVTASADGTARLWDAETGRELATFRGHVGEVNVAKLSPDGRWLATAGDDHTVRLWNVSPPGLRAICQGHTDHVRAVAVSRDGKTLASAGDDQVVRLWDAATGRERGRLEGHSGSILGVAISPDGSLLATAANDGVCQVWDLRSGRSRFQLIAHPANIDKCVSFSHDSRYLATGGKDRKIRIWDAATGAEKFTLAGPLETVSSVAFAPDDRTLAAGLRNGTVCRWELATGKGPNILMAHTSCVWDATFSPDGQTLAIASADGSVKLWDAHGDQTHKTISGPDSAPDAMAFSPDGQQVAAMIPGPGGERGSFHVWNVRTCAEQGSYLHLDGRLGGTTSTNGKAIVGQATIRGTGLGIRVISPIDGRWSTRRFVLNPLPAERPVTMLCLAMSPDRRLLATGHSHGKVTLWALDSGRERARMTPETGNSVCILRFSPDASLIASASGDGTVRLWDVESGAERATLLGHLGTPLSLAFSPDGTCLATAGADRTLKVWSTADGSELGTLPRQAAEIRTVAFSPDGKTLASGDVDGAIKLWDVATWQELISMDAHRGGVRSLAFSPDGSVLATSGAAADGRGEICLWTTAPGDD